MRARGSCTRRAQSNAVGCGSTGLTSWSGCTDSTGASTDSSSCDSTFAETASSNAASVMRFPCSAPICEHAIEWLLANLPEDPPESICWGDARIGNMIWQDFECKAVIDWEMCSLGSPAVDLGWWSFFHRWSTFGQGNPDLAGMCVGQPLADLYESRGGIHIDDFRFFEVLAAVRG